MALSFFDKEHGSSDDDDTEQIDQLALGQQI